MVAPPKWQGAAFRTMPVSSREAYVAPDHGAQANALKTVVMPFVRDDNLKTENKEEIDANGTHASNGPHRTNRRTGRRRRPP